MSGFAQDRTDGEASVEDRLDGVVEHPRGGVTRAEEVGVGPD